MSVRSPATYVRRYRKPFTTSPPCGVLRACMCYPLMNVDMRARGLMLRTVGCRIFGTGWSGGIALLVYPVENLLHPLCNLLTPQPSQCGLIVFVSSPLVCICWNRYYFYLLALTNHSYKNNAILLSELTHVDYLFLTSFVRFTDSHTHTHILIALVFSPFAPERTHHRTQSMDLGNGKARWSHNWLSSNYT